MAFSCREVIEAECLVVDPRVKPWDDGVWVGVLV